MGGQETSSSGEITRLMARHRGGDNAAWDEAVELLYDEMRALAHGQLRRLRLNDTLQTTALVNEVYVKLRGNGATPLDRNHFLAIAATAMRQVVIDYARSRRAIRRGGEVTHVAVDDNDAPVDSQAEQLLDIDRALTALAEQEPRWGPGV